MTNYGSFKVLKKNRTNKSHSISQIFQPIDFLLLKLPFTVHGPHDISATRSVAESVRLSVVLYRGNIAQTLCKVHASTVSILKT